MGRNRPDGLGCASTRLGPLVAPSHIPLGVMVKRAEPRRQSSPGDGGGACFHPPGSTRSTITYPVGGDSAKRIPTQAERRERKGSERRRKGDGGGAATAGAARRNNREIACGGKGYDSPPTD